ncbi:MAG: KdsC family phosphatase [Fidelibacterota bacterium]
MNRQLERAIRKIKIVLTDVDGVFTDGTIYKGNDGVELKRFSVLDGAGVALAKMAGLKVAIISGRYSPATDERARELGLDDDCYQGDRDKLSVLAVLKEKYGFADDEAAFIGDDLIDLSTMAKVGFPIAVANAHPLVKKTAKFTTEARGGEGAFREAVELILKGKGIYESTIEELRLKIENRA